MFREILESLRRQEALLEKQNELLERLNTLLAAADLSDDVYDGIQNIMTYGGMKRDT